MAVAAVVVAVVAVVAVVTAAARGVEVAVRIGCLKIMQNHEK